MGVGGNNERVNERESEAEKGKRDPLSSNPTHANSEVVIY